MTTPLGSGTIPRPGFGAMGLSIAYGTPDDVKSKEVLRKALEVGCTVINTADMYGNGHNERLIGEVLKEPGLREKAFLITKFGFRNDTSKGPGYAGAYIDGSKEWAAEALSNSIERLGTTPDAYIAHRIDKKVPIQETITALDELRKAGKTKYIGLSECSAATLREASKYAKVDFVEIEFSPWSLDILTNGVFDACKELGVVILAYSPLGRGFLTGRYKSFSDFASENDSRSAGFFPRLTKENFDQNLSIVHELEKLAKAKGVTPGQLSLAWLMAQHELVVPIPGTKAESRLLENFAARDIKLSAEELKELDAVIHAYKPVGDRYVESFMDMLDQ